MAHGKIYGAKQRNGEPIVGTAVWQTAKSDWLFRAGDCESGFLIGMGSFWRNCLEQIVSLPKITAWAISISILGMKVTTHVFLP